MRQKSIALLTCWYGPYPWYFPYFIHSCAYNTSVDFFVITENEEFIPNKPDNVKIIHKTLDELKLAFSEKLGFTVKIDYPYKLCDFKPAYGYLFSDLVFSYDYWGQSDLDIIFGDIRGFINHEMLNIYEFISVRHDYTTGCFALYKNTEKMNTFFKRSKDYQTIFSQSKHFCFDECNFAWDSLTDGDSILDLNTEIESFTELIKKAELTNDIKAHFDFILMEGIDGKLIFDDGKIIYKNQFEAILYHLYWLKKVYHPTKVPKKIPNRYFFSPSRIYHYRYSKTKLIKNL
jgi:hypothetical protein